MESFDGACLIATCSDREGDCSKKVHSSSSHLYELVAVSAIVRVIRFN